MGEATPVVGKSTNRSSLSCGVSNALVSGVLRVGGGVEEG